MASVLTPFLQRQRFQAIAPYLQGDVLDLGCGLANVTGLLASGQRYVGVEGPQSFIDWLRENRKGYDFYQRDLDKDELQLGRRFDTILMIAVIEHLANPGHILSQVPDHLNPGGRLVITTPSPWGDKIHQAGARLGLFSRAAMEEHETIFDFKQLVALLQRCGLRLVTYRRFLLGGNQLFISQALHPML